LRHSNKKTQECKTPVQIFDEGKNLVESYFDIVTMIRNFREIQMFMSTVLAHRQRLLLLFQRKLTISEFGNLAAVD